MESFARLMEQAIERIAKGEDPPIAPIAIPAGAVLEHEPTSYRIPGDFPNPPPPAPLRGQAGVRLVLAQCGLNDEQITRVMAISVTSLDDLVDATPGEIDDQIKQLNRLPAARGGVTLNLGALSRIKNASSLLHELSKMNNGEVDAYRISIPMLEQWKQHSSVLKDSGNDKISVSPPDSFDPKDWVSFKDGMVNYFRQTKGVRGIALYYVIREEVRPETATGFNDIRLMVRRCPARSMSTTMLGCSSS